MSDRMTFAELLDFYITHLTEQVMPFWLPLVDWEHGGLNNCVTNEGEIVSTDKYFWSQGRALWTFSSLYNDFDGDPEWLKPADNIAQFILSNVPDAEDMWPFALHQDGTIAEPPKSIYVEAFIAYGLTQYARATRNEDAIRIAHAICEKTSPLLEDHTSFPTMPHPIPEGLQSHGPFMIFALVYHDLGVLTGDSKLTDRSVELAERIMTQHLKPERQLLYELVRAGGELTGTDAGNTFIPGHVIESMWFMERIYTHHGNTERVELALKAIRWHLDKGWDPEYGGLYLACHAEGGTPVWHQPDAKTWWPHTEALYALLRAYEISRQPWCMDWYWRMHDYTFSKFPNRDYGDWNQNLDREGNIIAVPFQGLPVKDPFHLPRALIYSINTLRGLAEREPGADT